jgi:hypothetical protein
VTVAALALWAVGIVLAGCRSAQPAGGAGGALSATAAVQEFLAAAHGGSVQTMASLFGTANGAIAQRDSPNDVEKRMRTLQCYLTHDSARVLDDAPGLGAERRVTVELRQRNLQRRTTFTSIMGPHQRWYVESFDISAVTDLCHP